MFFLQYKTRNKPSRNAIANKDKYHQKRHVLWPNDTILETYRLRRGNRWAIGVIAPTLLEPRARNVSCPHHF